MKYLLLLLVFVGCSSDKLDIESKSSEWLIGYCWGYGQGLFEAKHGKAKHNAKYADGNYCLCLEYPEKYCQKED